MMFGFVSKRAYQALLDRYINVKAQRDRLNERNGTLAGELEEAGRVNGELQQRIRGFQAQLAEVERGYLAQLKDRDEALVALRLQLDEATKTPETTNEPQFAYIPPDAREAPTNGKKPGRSARGKARLISGQANTSGSDGIA